MKLISKAAMATALALGSIAMLGAPAIAAKKEKPPKAPEMKLGKEVRAALGAAQTANNAGDFATSKAKLAEADSFAKEPEERYWISQIRLELGTKAKDQAIQAEGVKGAIASGMLPATELPRFNFFAGKFAYDAKDYVGAKAALSESERLGYQDPNLYLLLAEANFKTNGVAPGLAYIEKAIKAEQAAGRTVPQDWYARAASVAYSAKSSADTIKWTRLLVKAYPTTDNWRSALIIYRDSTNPDNQMMLDLMRLMRLTKSLAGEKDYYEYADAAFSRGIYGEAKSVIDEGKAGGALNASNQAINDIYAQASAKIAADRKELAAAEKEAGTSNNFKIASGTADAFMGYGEDARAVPLYRIALAKGAPDKDTINTRIGIALVRSGDIAGARTAFAAVNPGGPRGPLISYWTLYLDQKQGGTAAPAAPAAPGS